MAFESLPGKNVGRKAGLGQVSVLVNSIGQVRFNIAPDVARAAGLKRHIVVRIGTGTDRGNVLIRPAIDHDHSTHGLSAKEGHSGGAFAVVASKLGVPSDRRSSAIFPHEVTADGLIVDIRPLMKPVAVDIAA